MKLIRDKFDYISISLLLIIGVGLAIQGFVAIQRVVEDASPTPVGRKAGNHRESGKDGGTHLTIMLSVYVPRRLHSLSVSDQQVTLSDYNFESRQVEEVRSRPLSREEFEELEALIREGAEGSWNGWLFFPVLDGFSFEASGEVDGRELSFGGGNAYPAGFSVLCDRINRLLDLPVLPVHVETESDEGVERYESEEAMWSEMMRRGEERKKKTGAQ